MSVDMEKSPGTHHRRDKVARRATCIKNVEFKIIKARTVCQYVGYLMLQRKPKLGRTKLSTKGHKRPAG